MIIFGLILERFRVKSLRCVKELIVPSRVSSKRCKGCKHECSWGAFVDMIICRGYTSSNNTTCSHGRWPNKCQGECNGKSWKLKCFSLKTW
jgi:hypothetical protein